MRAGTLLFAREGAKVVVGDLDPQAGEEILPLICGRLSLPKTIPQLTEGLIIVNCEMGAIIPPHWHHAVRGEQRYQGAHGNYFAGGDPVLYRGHAIRHLLDDLSLCLHLAAATMYKPIFGSF